MDAQKIAEIARRLGEEAHPREDTSGIIDPIHQTIRRQTTAKAWEKALPLMVKLASHAQHDEDCGTRAAHGSHAFAKGCTCGLNDDMEEFNHLTNT